MRTQEQDAFESNNEEDAEKDETSDSVTNALLEQAATDPRFNGSGLDRYMFHLKKYPVLRDQAVYEELFQAIRNGTSTEKRRARDLLVYGNMRLVCRIAMGHRNRGMGLEDLMQEGTIGLLRAIEKYEIEKGFRFSTYATHWIRQGMDRAIEDKNEKDPYRVPVHQREFEGKVRKTTAALYLQHGRLPTPFEVYKALKAKNANGEGLSLAKVVETMKDASTGKQHPSLDAPAYANKEDGETLGDRLCGQPPKTETIVEARRLLVEYRAALARIEEEVEKLPPRTSMVVRLRFGLGDFEAMTLEEVAERYNLTRERVRQIEAKALPELEQALGVTTKEIEQILETVQELEVIAHAI